MFLPIGDEPNPRGIAWVNWLLILLNVGIYVVITLPLSGVAADVHNPAYAEYLRVLMHTVGNQPGLSEYVSHLSEYDLFVFEHGFRPSDPTLATAFSAMFLHGGFMHLVGNMLFLWIYGDNVEARLGRLTYLFAYLLTGLVGNFMHLLLSGGAPMPLVGASGAISGVLGFYFVFFPENRVRVLVLLFPFYVDVVRIRARWVLGAYLILDNLLPVLLGSQSSVAYGAHLGGFLSGFFLARVWRSRDGVAPAKTLTARVPSSLPPMSAQAQEVDRMLREHDFPGATHAYLHGWGQSWLRDVPVQDALVMADWLSAQGEARAALAVYQRLLVVSSDGELQAQAHLGAGLTLLNGLGRPTDAYQHLIRALQLSRHPDVIRTAEVALSRIQELQKLKFRGR